jgi:hypothetical protein
VKHASIDKAKRVSSQCRNNGQCPYCRRSRTWRSRRVAAAGGAAMREARGG